MDKASYGSGGLIAAFATPLAESALAVIRCSGGGSIKEAARFFSRPEKLASAAGHSAVHGWIMSGGEKIDEVLVTVYRAPSSYTGEESLDVSCHGGIAAARAVMKVLRKAGFREALPGEFTFRAFMSGKLDLTRAESVMEMVSAKTDAGLSGAVSRLSGALENEIAGIREKLVEVLAGTEIYLDYSEDEFFPEGRETSAQNPPVQEDRLPEIHLAQEVLARLRSLSASYDRERLYHDGVLAVIAGRPNAGKSSLFNRLIGEDRAIVADVPGTTRDWIEAWVSIDGIPVRLVDTAGLAGGSPDPVEKAGVERSRELMAEADIVLYVIDGTRGAAPDDHAFLDGGGRGIRLAVWNKADAPLCRETPDGFFPASAKTGTGVRELCAAAAAALEKKAGGGKEKTGPGTARQKDLIDAAAKSLEEALKLAESGEALDLIAPFLRESADALGEITGDVSSADILEKMFSKFCVGK